MYKELRIFVSQFIFVYINKHTLKPKMSYKAYKALVLVD